MHPQLKRVEEFRKGDSAMPHVTAIRFSKNKQEFEVWWKELRDPTWESPYTMLNGIDTAMISKELVTAVRGKFIQAQLMPEEKVFVCVGRKWEFSWEPGRYLQFEKPSHPLKLSKKRKSTSSFKAAKRPAVFDYSSNEDSDDQGTTEKDIKKLYALSVPRKKVTCSGNFTHLAAIQYTGKQFMLWYTGGGNFPICDTRKELVRCMDMERVLLDKVQRAPHKKFFFLDPRGAINAINYFYALAGNILEQVKPWTLLRHVARFLNTRTDIEFHMVRPLTDLDWMHWLKNQLIGKFICQATDGRCFAVDAESQMIKGCDPGFDQSPLSLTRESISKLEISQIWQCFSLITK